MFRWFLLSLQMSSRAASLMGIACKGVNLSVTHLDLDQFLKKHLVVVHPAERRERVRQGIKVLLEDGNTRAVADEWLENWVVNSTEWPVPLLGGFDSRYLSLPREVLVTVMRDHQKYFAVEDQAGNLQS